MCPFDDDYVLLGESFGMIELLNYKRMEMETYKEFSQSGPLIYELR